MNSVFSSLSECYTILSNTPPTSIDKDTLYSILSISTSLCSLTNNMVEATQDCPGAVWRLDPAVKDAMEEHNTTAKKKRRITIECAAGVCHFTKRTKYNGLLICDSCSQTLKRDTKCGFVVAKKKNVTKGAF